MRFQIVRCCPAFGFLTSLSEAYATSYYPPTSVHTCESLGIAWKLPPEILSRVNPGRGSFPLFRCLCTLVVADAGILPNHKAVPVFRTCLNRIVTLGKCISIFNAAETER